MEEFHNPDLTSDKLYMIDKVVRMRGLKGRFGVDHSEILNFEFEVANKDRLDHMNKLVYKDVYNPSLDTANNYFTQYDEGDKENGQISSTLLFHRLS